jgi:hypothetical protein
MILNNKLSIILFVSIDNSYDYLSGYIDNVALNFTKRYPKYLIHKKSKERIEAFFIDLMRKIIDTFIGSEIHRIEVIDVCELSDFIAEYDMVKTKDICSTYDESLAKSSSLGSSSLEMAMSIDNTFDEIKPIKTEKPTGASGKPKIMKRSVIRVTMELEVLMETKQYLQFLQQIPDLLGLHEFPNLRCRVIYNQKKVTINEESAPIEVKVVDNRKYQQWFIAFTVLMVFCLSGIVTLFFTIPNLYKQDIHVHRNDTISQHFQIERSRLDMNNVSFPIPGMKDSVVIKDKKVLIIR